MDIKTPLLIAALTAGMAVTAAEAQGRGPGMPGMERPGFAELDADADGFVSRDEMRAPIAERLAAADADGSGTLDAAELVAAMQARQADRIAEMAERMIARRDADGDGALSLEELAAPAPRPAVFDRLDADGDGMLSEAEYDAMGERMRGRHGMGGEGGRHGMGHRDGGHGHGGGFFGFGRD